MALFVVPCYGREVAEADVGYTGGFVRGEMEHPFIGKWE